MNCRIIENSSVSHLDDVKRLLNKSETAFIASPFISEEAIRKLETCFAEKLKTMVLVTTMKPQDYDQVKKIPVLKYLVSLCELYNIDLTIRIDNRLHGKVYVGGRNGKYVGAIITSANFTENGLVRNHEWGVFIDNPDDIELLCEEIVSDTECEIDKQAIDEMALLAKNHQLTVPKRQTKMKLDLLDIIHPSHLVCGKGLTYWLKPFGTLKNPVPDSREFGEELFDVTFAKGVGNVKEGDILIAYAVKSQRIISIYEATSLKGKKNSFSKHEDERWPYYVTCINKTPRVGRSWSKNKLTLELLISSFLDQFPTKEIRPGSQAISVMSRGLDRLRLNKEFTEFVVGKVFEKEKSLL